MPPRRSGETEGRDKIAENFLNFNFASARVSREEFGDFVEDYIPEGFEARRPKKGEKVNTIYKEWVAIPLAHFEVGLRLPLWPEVCWVLRYLGLVPAQLSTNAIATLVAYACYMRGERIEFSLDVFRKLFSFRASNEGVGSFSCMKAKAHVTGLANKVHHWSERFAFVKGPLGRIPYSPEQHPAHVYKPPVLSRGEGRLYEFFNGTIFDVIYLRRNVDVVQYVPPKEGMRAIPVHPPYETEPIGEPLPIEVEGEGQDGEDVEVEVVEEDEEEASPMGGGKGKGVASSETRRVRPMKRLRRGSGIFIEEPPASPLMQMDFESSSSHHSHDTEMGRTSREPTHAAPSANPSLAFEVGEPSACPDFDVHPNFDLGKDSVDELGRQLLAWDLQDERVAVSTRLPSWKETPTRSDAAFSLSYGLYGRTDAEEYPNLTMGQLAHDSARSLLRSVELAHMAGRRGIAMSKRAKKAQDDLAHATEMMQTFKARAEVAEATLASMEGGLVSTREAVFLGQLYQLFSLMRVAIQGPGEASFLLARAEQAEARAEQAEAQVTLLQQQLGLLELQKECMVPRELYDAEIADLQRELARARGAIASGGGPDSGLLAFTPAEVARARRQVAAETAGAVIHTLRNTGALADEWREVTAEVVLPPEYFEDLQSPGYSPSPRRGRGRGQ